jgi:excinuclease UvrABC nuclease subunit
MQVKWSSFQDLTRDNIKKYVPTSPGVYLLWLKLKTEEWKCYYVGKAENLETRLLEHISDNEQNACIKNHVSQHINRYVTAEVARKADRDCIEKFLYDHYYKPECNQADPGGTPIPVNLP